MRWMTAFVLVGVAACAPVKDPNVDSQLTEDDANKDTNEDLPVYNQTLTLSQELSAQESVKFKMDGFSGKRFEFNLNLKDWTLVGEKIPGIEENNVRYKLDKPKKLSEMQSQSLVALFAKTELLTLGKQNCEELKKKYMNAAIDGDFPLVEFAGRKFSTHLDTCFQIKITQETNLFTVVDKIFMEFTPTKSKIYDDL